MLTRVVGKGRVEPFELERDTRYTIVDVGTGDGHYAYALAAERPEARVVAFDALEEPMAEIAHRARRRQIHRRLRMPGPPPPRCVCRSVPQLFWVFPFLDERGNAVHHTRAVFTTGVETDKWTTGTGSPLADE